MLFFPLVLRHKMLFKHSQGVCIHSWESSHVCLSLEGSIFAIFSMISSNLPFPLCEKLY